MSENVLQEAVDLIKNGNRPEARRILVATLQADPNNAQAWWLFAHAAPTKEMAVVALRELHRLMPDNPRVKEVLLKLGGEIPPPTPTLAELLSDAGARLVPDEPYPPPDADWNEEIGAWLDEVEKRKNEELLANQRREKVSENSSNNFVAKMGIALLFFVALIIFNAQRIADLTTQAVICRTAEGSESALASVNRSADPNITLPDDLISQGVLVTDEQVQVSLNAAHDKHAYIFEGRAGQRVFITMWAMDFGMNPLIEVYTPDRHQFAICDEFDLDNPGAQLEMRLPVDGQYTVVVYQPESDVVGRYGIEFTER
jgi:hypothetical protein